MVLENTWVFPGSLSTVHTLSPSPALYRESTNAKACLPVHLGILTELLSCQAVCALPPLQPRHLESHVLRARLAH